jgi:hypothetical protein
MLVRKTWIQLAAKAGIGLGALLLVGVLLAAIPSHRTPPLAAGAPEITGDPQAGDESNPSAEELDPGVASVGEHCAMVDMQHEHYGNTPHMRMTALRPRTVEDRERANEIVEQLRAGIEKYKDYHVALNDGFRIFMPNVPQKEYHFTNYANGFLEAFTFDPARPTSLLYKKTPGGYELVGAMYTMPKSASEEELNERVPLSMARWHLHTNLCMPPKGIRRKPDWMKFGLRGSISTQAACDAAGGTFYPVIFGWMVHIYPFEDSTTKVFAMHHAE